MSDTIILKEDVLTIITAGAQGPAGPAGGSVLTTKGDLSTYSTVDIRLAVGSNNQVLTADSAEVTGLKWAAAGALVESVNSYTGVVILDPDDFSDAATTNKFVTAADITILGNTSGTNTGDQDDVTIGTANGLSLSSQELSLAASTNATPGAATAAQITALEAATASLTKYDNVYIDAGAAVPTTTDGADTGTTEYATNDIMLDYFAFDATTLEKVQFKFNMPENWDRGTIKAKLLWTSDTGSTSGDTVEWGVKAGALSDSDAIDAVLGTGQVVSDALTANNGTDIQITSATPSITVGGSPALGDMIIFEAYRNVSGTDDMVEDAWLTGVWVQYKTSATVVAAW